METGPTRRLVDVFKLMSLFARLYLFLLANVLFLNLLVSFSNSLCHLYSWFAQFYNGFTEDSLFRFVFGQGCFALRRFFIFWCKPQINTGASQALCGTVH